jgi:hypothetical protein
MALAAAERRGCGDLALGSDELSKARLDVDRGRPVRGSSAVSTAICYRSVVGWKCARRTRAIWKCGFGAISTHSLPSMTSLRVSTRPSSGTRSGLSGNDFASIRAHRNVRDAFDPRQGHLYPRRGMALRSRPYRGQRGRPLAASAYSRRATRNPRASGPTPWEGGGTKLGVAGTFRAVSHLLMGIRRPYEWEWNMSDLRNTDPYRRDQSRRGTDQTGLWSWLAPLLTALGLLIGGIIGYNWGYNTGFQKSAESIPPATTGAAPPEQRHAPGTH